MPRILVIEDDARIAAGVVRALKTAGFEPELVTTGQAGLEVGLRNPPDLAVLDLGLPDISGQAVLEAWRARTSFPVLVLTAQTSVQTRVGVFKRGAIDYLAKPFFIEELLARIEARIGEQPTPPKVVEWADVQMDIDGRRLLRGGEELALTAHQFNVLAFLVERPGEAVSRQRLARHALSVRHDNAPRTVDTHVTRIRKTLGVHAAAAIKTVRAVGYRFDPPA